ncbi:MAG TPA: peptidylprolyl isomerase [Rudaea sp.]|nr:peptidylprolyl isomerase [Rudaea sp.]
MQAEKDKVVSFHYVLSDNDGIEIESSHEREPMAVLCGRGGIIPGLEQAMLGRGAGDHFAVVVSPAEGYGERREDFVQRVAKKYFRDPGNLKPGMVTMLQTKDGPRSITVLKVGSSVVDVDLNHPMAGKTLKFAIEITDVREASAEELAHGHAHGSGGHAH